MADEIYKPKMISGSVSMTFDRSLAIETRESEVYGDDTHIMEDGTIKVYRRWHKKVLYLELKGINQSTFNSLRNLRRSGNAVDYYRDRNDSEKYGTFMWLVGS